MLIHTSDLINTTKVLAAYKVDYTVCHAVEDDSSYWYITLVPRTKWQVFIQLAISLGPSEFDTNTNTLYLED